MRVNRPVTALTSFLVLAGITLDSVRPMGQTPDDSLDHSVPRVPLLLSTATGSAPASTSISAHVYTANLITGSEIRVPPRQVKAPQVQYPADAWYIGSIMYTKKTIDWA